MASTTITLALDGEVPLDLFAEAMQHWHGLIAALTTDSGDSEIEWLVEELEAGSAIATIRGVAEDDEAVDRVVRAYDVVGEALATGSDIPGSKRVKIEAWEIASILNGKITSIQFHTPNQSSVVSSAVGERPRDRMLQAVGAVEGRVQTLSSRKVLQFTLYDSVFDGPVKCYLQPGREEIMRDTWNHRAIVEGIVTRDPVSGRPLSIRRVERVTPIDDVEPGGFRQARGVLKALPNDPLPEELIRRLRDA